MVSTAFDSLLAAILDSWDRNNTILVNLARAIPVAAMDARVMDGSPSIGQMLAHMHYCRLVFIEEDVPEFAIPLPEGEWRKERDPERLALLLQDSSVALRTAVAARIASGQPMNYHYDHPLLMLQHFIWHEGYHHGQIKLALKLAGQPLSDDDANDITWGVWMNKTK
jgi:uncharacterized damage-inducible protein DinB